jgi:hypothetical protein
MIKIKVFIFSYRTEKLVNKTEVMWMRWLNILLINGKRKKINTCYKLFFTNLFN